MNRFTRRRFGKHLLAATALPLLTIQETQSPAHKQPFPPTNIPDTIAGYTLTDEEKLLAAKFFTTHENTMSLLRVRDLPNSLPPNFICARPPSRRESGEAKR